MHCIIKFKQNIRLYLSNSMRSKYLKSGSVRRLGCQTLPKDFGFAGPKL